MQNASAVFIFALGIFGFLAVLLYLHLCDSYKKYKNKLDYINREIERTTGNEREYWIKKRKSHKKKLLKYLLK